MRYLKYVSILLLAWGTFSFANVPETNREVQSIGAFVDHLNFYYPELELAPRADLHDSQSRAQVLKELQSLEGFMHGEQALMPRSLTTLACGRPVCDGGDGGKCSSCSAGN